MARNFTIVRQYQYDVNDLAVAFHAVVVKRYGVGSLAGARVGWRGLFARLPFSFHSIQVGLDEYTKGITGLVAIKQLPGIFEVVTVEGEAIITVRGVVEKYQSAIDGFLDEIKNHLDHYSIYRGKALTAYGSFLDLSEVSMDNVVYNEKVLRDLQAHVWTLMEQPDRCGKVNIGTRKVLFDGPYGSGKTLAAMLTAKKAVELGWTFFYLEPTERRSIGAVERLMSLVKKYQPSVGFIEDIDREQREGAPYALGSILTAIDGAMSKGGKMLLITTTNHIDKVNAAMQRPGRMDKIVRFNAYTAEDIMCLLKRTIPPDWFAHEGIDWNAVAKACSGYTPAFVLEVGRSAMLLAMSEVEGGALPKVRQDALIEAAHDLEAQYKKTKEAMGFTE